MAPQMVLPNVRLADMNVDIAHDIADVRRIEAVTNGLPLMAGSLPLLCRLATARRKPHQTYPELARARRCRLVVGIEVGGKFGTETMQLLRLLA